MSCIKIDINKATLKHNKSYYMSSYICERWNRSEPHLDQFIMLDPIDSYIRVKCWGHWVSGVDSCVLRDGDVYYSGLEKGCIVIYILDQEADLDQTEDLIRQHGHFNLIVAAFLSEDPRAQLLSVDPVIGGKDLPRVGLHPHQRHVTCLVHRLELQRWG